MKIGVKENFEDLGFKGESPLHFALKGGALDVALYLLQQNANPDLIINIPPSTISARTIINSDERFISLRSYLKTAPEITSSESETSVCFR